MRFDQGMEAAAPRAYRFDGLRVDLIRRQVVAADGTLLSLSSRAYDALMHLIVNRDRIVTKDDLMKAVWPNVVVEENNLNQAISSLRRAFGDQRESPRFIATIAGRGYRFVANVDIELQESVSTPVVEATGAKPSVAVAIERPTTLSRRALVAGVATVAAAGGGWYLWSNRLRSSLRARSIAVLPFQPLVEADDNAPLQLGMADTLINRLSALPDVVVAPFSSVRSYQHGQDPLAAGRALGVGAVLESNVQVQDDRVRVTARLLDVESGAALWSGRFDERQSDFFEIQDALAQQVADALEVQLTAASRQRIRRRDTDNVEAWQLYLRGRFHFGFRTEAGFKQAIALFEEALAMDPQLALASAGLADVWGAMGVFDMVPPIEAFGHARRAAERAIAVDDELAEAHATLGHVLVQGDRDWKRGEAEYRRAQKLNPAYTQAVLWFANNCCFQGRLDEALEHAQRAHSMEPASVIFAANVGLIQYCARRYEDARRTLTDLVDTMPQYALARRFLARVAMAQGNAPEALTLLKNHEAEYAPGALSDVGRALAQAGDHEAAQRELARLEQLGARGYGVGNHLALIHAALGNRDEALTALERGLRDGSQMITFITTEPGFDSLRADGRFRRVAQALRLA